MTVPTFVWRQKVVSKSLNQVDQEGKMAVRLRESYENEIVPVLMDRFGYKNRNQVPRLE